MRALLSVYDKTGLDTLARGLTELGWDLVASGNTSRFLSDAGIDHVSVESVTGAPEMLDGRVKTLHPKIHGGLLADREKPQHLEQLRQHGIELIDLVVSNLYPFRSQREIEMIDIGGPSMVRAAAKNHAHVGVIVDPGAYDAVLEEIRTSGSLGATTRRRLARDAFAHVAAYDAAIVEWLDEAEEAGTAGDDLPSTLHFALERAQELRYGENPHQRGARYRHVGSSSWLDTIVQHSGLALSYLNIYDAEAAWRTVHDLGDQPTCAIIKHANPCGAAVAGDIATAYRLAFECDERSAFGGIVAVNRPVDAATVEAMVEAAQADVIIAPAYEGDAVARLIKKRKNTRLLQAEPPSGDRWDLRQIAGGFLVQQPHHFSATRAQWQVVTSVAPTDDQWIDVELAWRLVGHVKSNAIVLVAGGQAVGIGAGQQNRVESGQIAAQKAAGRAKGGACASDAFYPFPDGVEAAASAGVAVVIQPGGAQGDKAVIARADELGLAMVFTGERHFLH